jgi:hypothetical protein
MTEATVAAAGRNAGRPPYKAAMAVFAVVLAGYVWTLAPSVTFWDAGEFIATSKILGIPHPPGTPLFTLLAHVWARFVPIGEFAYRTNLMTATFSAAGAALFFLLIIQVLRGRSGGDQDSLFTYGGAAAAALISAFVFTVWQNSNETEVYMVATFSIAATSWLAWLWREHRGEPRAPHILLLIVFFAAVSLGNHLLALLVGPPLIGFMAHVLKTEPLAREEDRRVEWGQWAVLVGVWALLIGVGLGNTTLLVVGGVVFVAAAIYAASVGGVIFAVTVLGIAVVGASTYLFLYFRANVGPFINEADPSTWSSLWDVIQRKQYPTRSPLDNPIYPSGPDNPGRSLTLIWWQIVNYLQYFHWQWANGLAPTQPFFAPVRTPFTLLFTALGIYGASQLWDRDRSAFWLLILLFLVTGPGLMGYMNFKPGYSVAWDHFPSMDMHEVRERDYFFTVSFQTWGLLVGIGLASLYRLLRSWVRKRVGGGSPLVPFSGAVLLIALLPIALNFKAASRRHGPEALLARDFAYSLLQSAEPYGIVFTNGDNDTFPLWYMQEVEGVRQDVSVVNLSLANTDWYLRQLRDNPVRPFDPNQAPWFADLEPDSVPPPLHSMSDLQITSIVPRLLDDSLQFNAGRIRKTFAAGTPLYVKDVLMLRLILENWNRRPIYYSVTAGNSNWDQLRDYITQEALLLHVNAAAPPDTTQLGPGVYNEVPVNIGRSDSLLWNVYRYADLFEADSLDLDPTNRNITTNLSFAYYSLGQAYLVAGETERAVDNLSRAMHLAPTAYPQLRSMLGAMRESSRRTRDTGMTDTTVTDTAFSDSGG